MLDDALSIVATGAVINTGAATSSVAIPADSAGSRPKYVRIAATQPCYVKLGGSGVTAAAGDILVQPADAVVLVVSSCTYVAAIQQGTAGVCQISPVENF